jgi:DNA-binding MarR family transcriptional regulator
MAEPDPRQAAAVAVDAGLAFFCYFRSELRERRPAGLSMAQFRFLHILVKDPDRSLSDMADDLGVSPPALSKMVDGLVERGLVQRKGDASDRRRITLAPTAAGQRLVSGFRKDLEQRLAERLATLPAAEQAVLAHSLQSLQNALASPQVIA